MPTTNATTPPSRAAPRCRVDPVLSPEEGFIVGQNTTYTVLPDGPLYTQPVAKRGYTRDTIRGGASEWDVSRPFSSYLKVLGRLLVHPIRFFELLPKVSDPRAPGLFLVFSSLLAALAWFLDGGLYSALAALLLPLPLSLVLAGAYHLATWGGRYGYTVTWRVLAYPFGYLLPLIAVPGLRWFATVYAVIVLLPVGLAVVKEITFGRA